MMTNNNSSSTMKHHQEAGAVMSYHRQSGVGGDDHGGGSSSPASVVQPPAAALSAVACSYDNNNNGKLASGVSGGALESSYNASTTSTRFQPNLHGISMDWTLEEQATLDEGLKTYATESAIIRYSKIAVQLKNKTVRDVALRYKWMMKRDFSWRRKDDLNLRKSKERKDKITNPSAKSSQALMQSVTCETRSTLFTLQNIDGVTGELLRQNVRAFEQISANLANYQIHNNIGSLSQIHSNIGLFSQARDNITQILKRINKPPYIMKQMPALPVKVNEELANSILPRSVHPMQ